MLLVVLYRKHFGIAVSEYLLQRVMVGEVNFEIGLEFHVLDEILKLSLAQLLVQRKFLCFLSKTLLMFGLDGLPEDID